MQGSVRIDNDTTVLSCVLNKIHMNLEIGGACCPQLQPPPRLLSAVSALSAACRNCSRYKTQYACAVHIILNIEDMSHTHR
jgi:hypothetical protein